MDFNIEIKGIPSNVNWKTSQSLRALGVYTGAVILSYVGIKKLVKRVTEKEMPKIIH